MRRNPYFVWAFLFAIFFASAGAVQAADSYTIANGANTNISEHSVCQKVTNATGRSIMVPTKASAEWLSFRNNPPSGVTLGACLNLVYVTTSAYNTNSSTQVHSGISIGTASALDTSSLRFRASPVVHRARTRQLHQLRSRGFLQLFCIVSFRVMPGMPVLLGRQYHLVRPGRFR